MFYDRVNLPPRRKHFSDDLPSMTLQDAAPSCDINSMVERFRRTGSYHGMISQPSVSPQYGDFFDLPSYDQSLKAVIMAQEMFAGLPANVRDRFVNDPSRLMSFLADPDNFEEAVKLGLCKPRPKPEAEAIPGPVTT